VSGSDVSGLELLELLLGAKFIGLRRGEPPPVGEGGAVGMLETGLWRERGKGRGREEITIILV
jgi:hypothetical protein